MKVHRLLFIVFYLWNIIVKLRPTRFGATFFGHLSFSLPLMFILVLFTFNTGLNLVHLTFNLVPVINTRYPFELLYALHSVVLIISEYELVVF